MGSLRLRFFFSSARSSPWLPIFHFKGTYRHYLFFFTILLLQSSALTRDISRQLLDEKTDLQKNELKFIPLQKNLIHFEKFMGGDEGGKSKNYFDYFKINENSNNLMKQQQYQYQLLGTEETTRSLQPPNLFSFQPSKEENIKKADDNDFYSYSTFPTGGTETQINVQNNKNKYSTTSSSSTISATATATTSSSQLERELESSSTTSGTGDAFRDDHDREDQSRSLKNKDAVIDRKNENGPISFPPPFSEDLRGGDVRRKFDSVGPLSILDQFGDFF